MRSRTLLLLLCSLLPSSAVVAAQDVREHTRSSRPAGTSVTESQANDLTLTLTTATPRLIQTWVRTAGTIDATGRILAATVRGAEAALITTGQRVRAFPPSSKSSMYQARITRAAPQGQRVAVEAALASTGRENTTHYVMEIVVERGPFLAVPNEAIIEEEGRRIVYVQRTQGQYVPQEIHTGIQGELLTEIVDGLKDGDEVVTFGSFFIDAEHKLKATDQGSTSR
jgi:hypothetical protein